MELFDGYQASREELIQNNWYIEDFGYFSKNPRFQWERWISPDKKLIATFWWGHETATICRNIREE